MFLCSSRSKLPLKKKVALRTRAYRGKKEHKNKQGDKASPSHSANKKRVSQSSIANSHSNLNCISCINTNSVFIFRSQVTRQSLKNPIK